jgi:hypothetical protein
MNGLSIAMSDNMSVKHIQYIEPMKPYKQAVIVISEICDNKELVQLFELILPRIRNYQLIVVY